jgi:hypothetical protein
MISKENLWRTLSKRLEQHAAGNNMVARVPRIARAVIASRGEFFSKTKS